MQFGPSMMLRVVGMAASLLLVGCAGTPEAPASSGEPGARSDKFEQDRQAILAMAGTYKVTFNFIETVALAEGYEIKDPKVSGGHEVVRVIRDDGEVISLQHLLVVGQDEKIVVKHWRQDWVYEPDRVFDFLGGNAWRMRELSAEESAGKWAQLVYQVDDAPRYAAVAAWEHENGVSAWTSPKTWRPLPRRDATTRDDYHVIEAVNRHALTPDGWVHEQDNTKLVLTGSAPQALVREIGYNSYERFDDFDVDLADDYWAKTRAFWADIRAEWMRMERDYDAFGLTIQGEPEALYTEILDLAEAVKDGEEEAGSAAEKAVEIIGAFTIREIGTLSSRIGQD